MELYKKYRPSTLDRVVGNEGTVAALRNMIERKTLPHCVLFHGPSGCGKTTLARIAKDALGCHDLDCRELNSASFRGIDTVREIQRTMPLAPAAGPVRVWIIDEAHKLSNDAQNAALKMLEDTPGHVYFFICTTDPNNLIKAILTRCCEMPVVSLRDQEVESLIGRVCKKEGIPLSERVRDSLVMGSQGSARTALVLLDKIAALDESEQEAAIEAKLAEENGAIELCRALIQKAPWKKIAKLLQNLTADPEEVRWSVLGYARTVLLREGSYQAYLVIDAFSRNFYDSKAAGLALACYEAANAK